MSSTVDGASRKELLVSGVVLAACLPPLVYAGNPAVALLVGASLSIGFNRSLIINASAIGRLALQSAIVLLGFRLDVMKMADLSGSYALVVGGYVMVTLLVGLTFGYLLRVDRASTSLVSAGTAICGGTAIASLSPIVRATSEQTGVVMTMVFLLNAVALFTFPLVGQWLSMSQQEFGLWVALAVHDTSSVVATAAIYGEEAAEVATTLKLGRTLWLIPMLLVFSIMAREQQAKLRIPLFVLLFVAASVAGTLLPIPGDIERAAGLVCKALLVAALFCIGLEVSRTTLQQLRGKVLVQGLLLWACVVPATLLLSLYLA